MCQDDPHTTRHLSNKYNAVPYFTPPVLSTGGIKYSVFRRVCRQAG
jgi:hypothetical protein